MEKLLLWGDNIPFNSKRSKLKDLDIHEEYTLEDKFISLNQAHRRYPFY